MTDIPTRVSTEKDDPGYREDASRWTVVFNGVPQPEEGAWRRRVVFTADSSTGELLYAWADLTANGFWKIETTGSVEDPEGSRVVRRHETGTVEIVPRRLP